ncbi:MerR family transcriptional regulator [Saccharothrix longispora]|uniref:DNA-binding transcriptional MerR regulator n=1 Tax=Saccharothrix longispora TaxID=33920 RepID=A0ABU1PPV3_9PSEU|nr:MerR family transcriptional regulator [Saccharothrix longispora]MDR6592697.1 DNA-binding transcriptional MerR regulator [Saccharothrix longispora]
MTAYRISQLAERVGLRPTTLRFYEQAGLLPAQRSGSGYQLYGDDAVERLGFITAGKRLGLPLEEIRELLDVWEDGVCTDVRRRLRPMLRERIARTERTAAELRAFTDRLRGALDELDGPPPPGRCAPGCGLPHGGPGPVPVTVEPRGPRPGERGAPPIACALVDDDRAERVRAWRRLLERATGRRAIDRGLRITLPANLAGRVAGLAAAEQRCCAFFEFSLHLSAGDLQFDVRAPEDAAALLTEVFGAAG